MTTQTKDYSNKIFTIPNILSMFRIVLIPVCVWLYCVEKNYLWTTIVLFISGVTDTVDGFIARKFNMISNLGKALDPVADKLTQFVMMICLISRFPLMLAPTVLMFLKEGFAGITGLMIIHKEHVVLGAEWHGKIVTILLYLTIGLHLIWYNIPAAVSNITIIVCVVMMMISMVIYSAYRIKVLKNCREEKSA